MRASTKNKKKNKKQNLSHPIFSDKYKKKSQTEQRIAIFAINRRKSLNKMYKRKRKKSSEVTLGRVIESKTKKNNIYNTEESSRSTRMSEEIQILKKS